jgi:hypothetical protein
MKMIKLIGIKCNKTGKIYITKRESDDRYIYFPNYFVDGKIPKNSFHKSWGIIDKEPIKIEIQKSQPDINHRFELKDKSFESEKIPLILKREDCQYYDDDNYEWYWKNEYKDYISLYEYKSDSQPFLFVEQEFEYKTILEVEEIKPSIDFKFQVKRTQWDHDGTRSINESDLNYQLIDKIIFPEIVLPSRPCKLDRQKSYEIVRQYVKNHINPKIAEITSDYDFCFTVKKKIKLSEKQEYKVDVNNSWFNKRKRKPKWEKRYRLDRSITIFEMAPKAYKNYTVIEGFRGENHEDLQNNINDYLSNLIAFINEPIKDCPHCKGEGVIFNKNLKEK